MAPKFRSMIPLFLISSAANTVALGNGTVLDKRACQTSATPVTACGAGDLTTANWAKFNIDEFLLNFIINFGAPNNFPQFFVSETTPVKAVVSNFDCSSLNNPAGCTVSFQTNPDAATNCIFQGLQGTTCALFQSPEAGFVFQNYLGYYQGLLNHFEAVQLAANNINNANFINTMVQALAPKKEPIAPAVFRLIADLVVDILPIGGEIKAATTFVKKARLIIQKTRKDVKKDGKNIVSVIEDNEAIDREVSATEDQLRQQLANMVTGTRARLQEMADQVFGPVDGSGAIRGRDEALGSEAFLNAQGGMFLDDVPRAEDLIPQMQKQMQNWIVSSTMSAMGYDLTIDTTELFDDPANPGGVCTAEKGFNVPGGCALFRIHGIGSDGNVIEGHQGNDIFALENVAGIDIRAMIANAEGCAGGSVDFEGFLAMENTDALPRCMFNFPVVRTAL